MNVKQTRETESAQRPIVLLKFSFHFRKRIIFFLIAKCGGNGTKFIPVYPVVDGSWNIQRFNDHRKPGYNLMRVASHVVVGSKDGP